MPTLNQISNPPIASVFEAITPAEMDARINISFYYSQRVLENMKLARQKKMSKK